MGQHDSKSLELLKITQNEFAFQILLGWLNILRMDQEDSKDSANLLKISQKGSRLFNTGPDYS